MAEVAAANGRDPLELAASGGEDYELLAALPPDRVERAVRSREGLTPIGDLLAGEGVEVRRPDGALLDAAGFDQLT